MASKTKEADAAAKRQQALTEAQATGDQDAIAKAQSDIAQAFESAEADAERDAEAAAEDQKAADQASQEAEDRAAAADSAAFRAQSEASTANLLAQQPARQVPYLPTQVVYRQATPPIEPQQFRQVVHPKTGHVTNEGIRAKE